MTNITKLYQQLQEGKTTRDYFVREARRQFPQFISPVSSFNDIVNVLKGKRLVSEELTKEVSGAKFDAIGEATTDEAIGDSIDQQMMSAKNVASNIYDSVSSDSTDEEIVAAAQAYAKESAIAPEVSSPKLGDSEWLQAVRSEIKGFESVGKGEDYGFNNKSADREEASYITETHKLDTEQILDRMSPYAVRKGIEVELKKEKVVDKTTLDKVRTRVAKKLQKNREAYNDMILANVKSIDKQDKDLETKEVKQELVDKKNAMRKPKGFKAEKANTKASKKENKKGKPKGVKVMPDKGVTGTEKVIKEDVLNNIKEWLQENVYRDYREGMEVKTPDGHGIVKEVRGGTLTVELQDEEKTTKDYQFNIVNKMMDEPEEQPAGEMTKAERDAAWSKIGYNMGSVKGTDTGIPKSYKDMTYEEKLKAIMEKVQSMEEGEKKQKALEIVKKKLDEAGDIVTVKKPTGEETLVTTTAAGKGQNVVKDLKSKGITSAKSTSAS